MADITSKDLMTFLEGFRNSMEEKIQNSKETLEKKIDKRIDDIDEGMEKLNTKIDKTDAKTDGFIVRMNARMSALEKEMAKSQRLKRQSDELRKNLMIQPVGTETSKPATSDKADNTRQEPIIQPSTFRSSWAQELQDELQNSAELRTQEKTTGTGTGRKELNDQPTGTRIKTQNPRQHPNNFEEDRPEVDRQVYDTPDNWEELDEQPLFKVQPTRNYQKIRKPLVITSWFGDETSSDSESSEDSESWSEVDRRRKNLERRRRRRKLKKEKEQKTSTRASSMAGVGPIERSSVMNYMDRGLNFEQAKIAALKKYLKLNLGYNESELESLSIEETKFASKGESILYIALSKPEQIKELHMRRAESKNEKLTVRNYIPPNMFERYMAINRQCTAARAMDATLKTQLRFGRHDVELYIKTKGGKTGYRFEKLENLIDMTQVPTFDHRVKWRKTVDQPPRRIVHYNKTTETEIIDPLSTDTPATNPGITRANSNSNNSQAKKQKLGATSSESEGEGDTEADEESDSRMEDESEHEVEDTI